MESISPSQTWSKRITNGLWVGGLGTVICAEVPALVHAMVLKSDHHLAPGQVFPLLGSWLIPVGIWVFPLGFLLGLALTVKQPVTLPLVRHELPAPLGLPRAGVLKLDLETPFESSLTAFAGLSLIFALWALICVEWKWAAGFALLSATLWGLRSTVENYYELSFDARELRFHWNLLGRHGHSVVARVGDLTGVTSTGLIAGSKNAPRWEYATCLIMADGRLLQVSNHDPSGLAVIPPTAVNPSPADRSLLAWDMARHLGIPFYEPRPEYYLAFERDGTTGCLMPCATTSVPTPPSVRQAGLLFLAATGLGLGWVFYYLLR